MAKEMMQHAKSLFDFGPMAREYDRWYETPAGQAHDRVQKDDVRRLVRPASAGQTLLDVGCGTGHWSAFFAEMGYEVTGVDVSHAMIEAARSAVFNVSFRVADAHELPFGDGAFDIVAAMATVEFLCDPETAVGEMARCTKAGGHVLIGTLNRLARLNQDRLANGEEPYLSAQLLSPDGLLALLASVGPVRMLASPSTEPNGQRPLAEPEQRRTSRSRSTLRGPFIVAEVRL